MQENTPLSDEERSELERLRAEKAAREEAQAAARERAELERLKAMVVEVMDNVVPTAAPMRADVGVGDNWALAH